MRPKRTAVSAAIAAGVIAAALTSPATAMQVSPASFAQKAFNHVGTFNVPDNLLPGEDLDTATSAEIADHAVHGTELLYTDALTGRLGFVNILNPALPLADGTLDVGGSPTSVAVAGKWALVLVDTSPDFVNPSGKLLVVDVTTKSVVRTIELAGQPDSIALGPNGRYAAIVIENQRDEELNDGLITPAQLPAGSLQILELRPSQPERWTLRTVDLTGLADFAPDDPEAEFVDINTRNQAVVSLQENNHFVIVDLVSATVLNDFPAGSVTIADIDATEDDLGPQGAGIIQLGETVVKRREPDAVHWIDDDTFASANEGDYDDGNEEGGSRGFTLFNKTGAVEWESGSSFEHWIVRAGHYPEARSENKGNEPEGLEVANFGARTLLFVGAERANVVGVYDVTSGTPVPLQLLATGIGPEGIRAIPQRDLLAVSSEVDGKPEGFDVRSLVTLYRFKAWPAAYPQLVSGDEGALPIPWVAISGLAGDPGDAGTVWAVSDSALAQAYVYRLDVSAAPARIEERIPVGDVDVADQHDGDFDLEGIAARPEGGFWLASEGRTNVGSSRPNLIVRTDAVGTILDSIDLPAGLVAGANSSGLEGIAVSGSEAGGDEIVWVALQREWADDPPGLVKIGRYEIATDTWTFAHYPLDPEPAGVQIGLSEITLLPDGHTAAIVERDDQIALDAQVKRIYGIDLTSVTFAPFGDPLPVLAKTLLRDVLTDLDERSISVPDKLEGVAVTADGQVYLATDNDGVDENYGETLFFGLGSVARAFGL